MSETFDVIVIGAGIVGMSVASALAGRAQVAVLERELRPGRQGTARAVSLLRQLHRAPELRQLAADSDPFFLAEHEELAGRTLTRPRGLLILARADQERLLDRIEVRLAGSHPLHRLEGRALAERLPVLRPGYACAALSDDHTQDLDVPLMMALHQTRLEARGGRLFCAAPVSALGWRDGTWRVDSGVGAMRAPVLVNAAGAWAERVARMAGARPIGLRRCRRTVLELEAAGGRDLSELPMVVDADLHFYLKPEGDLLLASPVDETVVPGCAAEPDELDVTLCLDRIAACFDIELARVRRVWAGLRCYVADGLPVCGWAEDRPGFFWMAGQGATGIQTSPALAELGASQILGETDDSGLADRLSPRRLGPG
ncbi:Hydrogen cyanide synthase subunit HcnC precursor [Pseudooceanicola marinus]|uniref:Hydrogen cyanide synthase subunit HcnC n=1 Tax=Pseudooceanicola marinus TaxID=396013 RepID=A0A1X6ZP65_9RHOB|nr:FAD-dependent oxidoreductase [Pseudooceanicola marinus]PJE26692.1 FAD-binding oxidoreductase [Pseudooceanicola marinus]SLN56768.1 Hydrogen cyanide synthase subunit HcnC precursor [Pseudooceanicola marinus]